MPSWRRQLLVIFLRWKIRPWPLLTPLLVLLIALPLLRPLRAPAGAGPHERLLLDTVESLSTRGSMVLEPGAWKGREGTVQVKGRTYPDRPPVFAVLLAAPAWAMQQAGLSFDTNAETVAYLLTLLGTTLPVAVGGGVIYRMGRLFELSRPKRALLAGVVTFGGGWISYATVLNPHAPAAAALVCAAACLLYLAAAKRSTKVLPITVLAGLCSALAAAMSPWTLPLVLPLPLVLFTTQLATRQKVIGFILMTLGAMPIAWVHAAWSLDSWGSVFAPGSVSTLHDVVQGDPDEPALSRVGSLGGALFTVTLGNHGIFTHFPVLIAGVAGLLIVLRKHWPMHAKMFAAITFVGAITIVMLVAGRRQGIGGWMFAVQWFVCFLPLVTFWTGALLRRELGRRVGWALAAACGISVVVSIAGAMAPLPAEPYRTHTALGAIERWFGSRADDRSEPLTLAR